MKLGTVSGMKLGASLLNLGAMMKSSPVQSSPDGEMTVKKQTGMKFCFLNS